MVWGNIKKKAASTNHTIKLSDVENNTAAEDAQMTAVKFGKYVRHKIKEEEKYRLMRASMDEVEKNSVTVNTESEDAYAPGVPEIEYRVFQAQKKYNL
jgi:hypothetical protein